MALHGYRKPQTAAFIGRLTYDKVVKTTLKYMKHAVIVTSND